MNKSSQQPPNRFVQGMVIGKYKGPDDKKANALEVFNIPDTEHDEFLAWLSTAYKALHNTLHRSGFVSVGTRSTLQKVADAYKQHQPTTRIGWVTVPMESNTVVLWRGIHRVTKATRKKDEGCYRTCLYLCLSTQTSVVELPDSVDEENVESFQQGKSPNRSIEPAVRDYSTANGQPFGWNKQTIPTEDHSKFSLNPTNPQPVDDPATFSDHSVVEALKENGFVVLPNALPDGMADTLHHTIVELVRTMMFRIPRVGMDDTLRQNVLTKMSTRRFAKKVNHELLKEARYFKRNDTAMYCGDGSRYDRAKRMKCLQGVQGLTLSSQMVDVYSHPYFATVLATLHPTLKKALEAPLLYYSKERCSLRSFGSAELAPHIDEPIGHYGGACGAFRVCEACEACGSPLLGKRKTV